MLPPSEFEKGDFKGDYPPQQLSDVDRMRENIRAGRSVMWRPDEAPEERSTRCSDCDTDGCEYVANERETDTCCYCGDVDTGDWCSGCQESFPDTYADLVLER